MVVLARDGTKSMVARAFSVSPSFDMVTGSTWRGLNIVVTWGYNTFLAVPETMYEAWKLYRKKAVVYTRPEVLVGSGQRDATKAERFVPFSNYTYCSPYLKSSDADRKRVIAVRCRSSG